MRDEPGRAEVYGEFARIEEAEQQAASAITMLALVNRADARLELAPIPGSEPLPELVPAVKPVAEPEPAPKQTIEVPRPADIPKPQPEFPVEAAKPAPTTPEPTIANIRSRHRARAG